MLFVIAAPEFVTAAATDLADIGSSLRAANVAAAAPTTGVLAAAENEVSVAIASLFSGHGQAFQALSARAAVFHAEFVQALNSAGGAYAAAEGASSSNLLQDLVGAAQPFGVFSPVELLTGRPLFGNGANGAPGTLFGDAAGGNGGDGGWIIGNGGNGGNSVAGAAGGAGGTGANGNILLNSGGNGGAVGGLGGGGGNNGLSHGSPGESG
jgi:PE family